MIYAKREHVKVPVRPRPAVGGYIHRPSVTESWVEERIGTEDFEAFRQASMEIHIPLPILGCGPCFLYQGELHPVIAGGAGFASLSDLITEMTTGGKGQFLYFNKTGVAGVIGRANTLWYATGSPGVGATAAALAAGTNHTRATQGSIMQNNATGGDQLHLIGAEGSMSVAAMGLLLYDRIWAGEPVVTSTSAQTVTMTPTRYATTGASGTSNGNVVFCEVRTIMGAGTPNLTLNYVDNMGNAAENAAVMAAVTAAAAATFLYPNQLFLPLNTGDAGVSDIIQWTQSATMTSGAYALVLGHPLMYIPALALANTGYIRDGINSAINLQRIYDDCCLALIEPMKGAATATTFTGFLTLAAG